MGLIVLTQLTRQDRHHHHIILKELESTPNNWC